MKRRLTGLGSLLLLAMAGCSPTVTGTAELTGSVDSAAFPGNPTAIEVRDETGTTFEARLGDAGSFAFSAREGHEYSLAVKTSEGSIPVLFPRANGELDSTFSVSGIGASAALGALRLYHEVPKGGFVVTQAGSEQCGHQDGEEDDDDHEDGEEDDDHVDVGDGDGEVDDDFEGPEGDGDGEVDDDPVPASFAVPDAPPPNQLGCDDDDDDEDGEEEDDDEETDDD